MMPRSALQLTMIVALLVAGVAMAVGETRLPPRSDRAVYDLAEVIDAASEARIEALSQELYAKTQVALVVVTVAKLDNESIEELAVRAGQTWGVGRKGQDRGLVVALARAERKIFVATGYGTEGYLPDGKIGRLLDSVAVPFLRVNRFSDGLVALSIELARASAKEFGVELNLGPAPSAPPRPSGGALHILLLVLGILVFAYLAWRHPALFFLLLASRGGSRGGGGFGGGGGFKGFGGGGFGGGGGGRGF